MDRAEPSRGPQRHEPGDARGVPGRAGPLRRGRGDSRRGAHRHRQGLLHRRRSVRITRGDRGCGSRRIPARRALRCSRASASSARSGTSRSPSSRASTASPRGWVRTSPMPAIWCSASDEARFIEVFVRRGIALDAGGGFLLPRHLGLHKAKELVFFGDDLSAADAERLGLVNGWFPLPSWRRRSAPGPSGWRTGPTFAIGMSKRLLNRSLQADMDTLFAEEAFTQALSETARTCGRAYARSWRSGALRSRGAKACARWRTS